jgi:mRNA-degrading endonuclease RelE of RelBE toxin-antitoxin system
MTIRVEFSRYFEKELRRLYRKYPSIVDEVEALVIQLQQGELPGDKIPNVGYNVYKARLRNRSAGRGKRSGFRVIYYVQRVDFVGMITIYFKSEQQDIRPERIRALIEQYEVSTKTNTDDNAT